jgi:hypothetical protein
MPEPGGGRILVSADGFALLTTDGYVLVEKEPVV